MQWAAKNAEAPFDLPSTFKNPFLGIWGGATWELENLALFNQAAYTNVASRNQRLDDRVSRLKQVEGSTSAPDDDEEYEAFEMVLARERQAIMNGELEVDAISRYADEVTIVASWAFVEKHLNETLRSLQSALGVNASGSHRWPDIEQAYSACGIDLPQLANYADANECRQVNNAIKHSGVVSGPIANLPTFAGKSGSRLEDLELDVQRYFFSAGGFVGAVIEESAGVAEAQVP